MKKNTVLALVAASFFLSTVFLLRKPKQKFDSSFDDLKKMFDEKPSLLICRGLKSAHIESSLGAISIKASTAFVDKNHTILTTNTHIDIKEENKIASALTANEAFIEPKNHTINLFGNVQGKREKVSIQAEGLSLNWRDHTITASGRVEINTDQTILKAQTISYNYKEQTLNAQGNVHNEFKLTPGHKQQH